MKVVLLGRDLIIASRILEAGARAGADVQRVDDPADLPAPGEVRLLLVDWGDRRPDWGEQIRKWRAAASAAQPKVLLFGPHVDLVAHAAARASGLGPMRARSRLVADLASLFG